MTTSFLLAVSATLSNVCVIFLAAITLSLSSAALRTPSINYSENTGKLLPNLFPTRMLQLFLSWKLVDPYLGLYNPFTITWAYLNCVSQWKKSESTWTLCFTMKIIQIYLEFGIYLNTVILYRHRHVKGYSIGLIWQDNRVAPVDQGYLDLVIL